MKKYLSIILAAIFAASALASCAALPTDTLLTPHSSLLTSTSSAPYADSAWLASRLGEMPANVTVGTASSLGIDMTDFENDGYIIRTTDHETVVAGKTAEGLDMAVRRFAKAYEKGEADDFNVAYHEGHRIEHLTVAGNDISTYTVVTVPDTNTNAYFGATELVRLVEIACGVRMPISTESVAGHKFVFTESDDPELKDDGYRYEVKNGDVLFTVAKRRGSMNGVWRFLDKELGWDGLIYGDAVLAEADHVDVPEGTKRAETPAFAYYTCYEELHSKVYSNPKGSPANAAQNGYGTLPVACHGLQTYRFCEEDYGARQICYMDETRYQECLENVTVYVENHLTDGNGLHLEWIGKEFRYVDIAQGDTQTFCNCKECRRVFKEEGGNSGAVVRFANRLSEEINDLFPSDEGIAFLIFAYCGTNQAPAVTKPNDYIWVSFCYDGNCSNHRMDGTECTGKVYLGAREGRDNILYNEWLSSWSAVTDKIYVWYYDLDTVLKQYNVFSNLLYDMQYLRDHNVQGVFWQCQNHGLGCQYIQHMVANELNWDTYMSEDEYEELICRVLKKEFGDGWEEMRQYFRNQSYAQSLVDCWHCWGEHMRLFEEGYVTAHFDENFDHFEEAIALADSRMQERQAEILSIHCLYEGAYAGYKSAYLAQDQEKIDFWCSVYDLMVERMNANGFNVTAIATTDGARSAHCTDLLHEVWTKLVLADNYYGDLRNYDPPIEIPEAEE